MNLPSIGALIDLSFEHYKRQFGDLLRVTGWLGAFILLHIIAISFYPIGAQELTRQLTGSELFGVALFVVNTLIVLPVTLLWAMNALIRVIHLGAADKSVKMRAVSAEAWRLFLPQLWIRVLVVVVFFVALAVPLVALELVARVGASLPFSVSMLLMLLSLALFLAPLALIVLLAFPHFELVVDGRRGWQAVVQSAHKIRRAFWPVLARLAAPKALYFLIAFLAQYLLLIVLRVVILAVAPVDDDLFAARIEWMLQPVTSIVILIFLNPLLFVTDYHIYTRLPNAEARS